MTISYPTNKIKSPQGWRNKKKRYYLAGRHKNGYRSSAKSDFGTNKPINFNFFPKLSGLKTIKGITILIVFFILAIFIGFIWLSHDLPDPNHLIDRQVAQSTKIYDRTGQTILYEIHGDQKRTLVSLKDIPDNLKNATIAIEDKDFYKHGGFSLWAIFRTVVTDILFRRTAGASTLTQQFIKNAVLTNEKTFTRKIKEIILAYRVEKKFTKDEILQMYLNEIPYGSTAYGVEAASQKYFGKGVGQINLAEAAILAALPQAPSRYSPYGPNKDLLISRQKYILDIMVKQGYITKDQANEAKNNPLTFKEPTDNITAPHFVMYVKELLADKYGEKMVEQDGLKIYTTLDLYKQKIAEDVIKERTPANKDKYQANNAALVSLDPKNGQILAMVGSKDYSDNSIDGQVNVALQPRQPGSSFKPVVYAASFIKGYTPNTILYDVVTNFSTDPEKPYEPHNYDSKEHGPVTIRQALAGSLNIPAVKTIYLAGINNVLDLAQSLGYTTLNDRSRFGLSLVLGGGEVKLLEHANAYSAFAREGVIHPLAAILKVEDKNGNIIEELKNSEEKVLDSNVAREINSILSDNSARAYIFGEKNYLTLSSRPVAAKTGTTNDYRDAWTIGYTPSIVTGVWVGNNDNKEMKRGADGSQVAAPIWHDFMERVLGDTPIEYFKDPDITVTNKPVLDGQVGGLTKVKIDKFTGLLATDNTPPSYIIEKSYVQPHDILYYVNKDDPRGPAPADPNADPQFSLWEKAVLAWAQKQGYASSTPPTQYDNAHLPEYKPNLTIESPTANQSIMEPTLVVNIKVSAPRSLSRVEYYIDDLPLATVSSYPFNLNYKIDFLDNGFHGLTVRAFDDIDDFAEQKIEFNLILNERKINKDVGINLSQPKQDLTLNSADLPYLLKADLSNPAQIAKVTFTIKNQAGETIKSLTAMPQGNSAQINLDKSIITGSYKLSAEVSGWNGQTAKSKEINLTVNNQEILN